MELGTVISIISCIIAVIGSVLGVSTFVLNRKDKAIAEAKEVNIDLINYRLNGLDNNIQKVLVKLDNNTTEIETRINKAMEQHLELFHKHDA